MEFTFAHNNFNVLDLEKSLKFYEEALGLKEARRKVAEDGSFILVYGCVTARKLIIWAKMNSIWHFW